MTKKLIIVLTVLWTQWSFATYSPTHFDIELAKNRCFVNKDAPIVYLSDFSWNYTLIEMADAFLETYDSGKRLNQRAEYDPISSRFRM